MVKMPAVSLKMKGRLLKSCKYCEKSCKLLKTDKRVWAERDKKAKYLGLSKRL